MAYTKAQRIEYAKNKIEGLKQKLNELADSIVTDPVALQKFVNKWNKGFHGYSFNNTLLIYYQNPEATLVAGKGQWLKNHKRNIKSSKETPIAILAPRLVKDKEKDQMILVGFNYVHVYDITQTEGEPVHLGAEEYISGESKFTFEQLVQISPVEVSLTDLGVMNGRAWTYGIEININRNELSKIKTLIHEIAHIYLGHLKRYTFTEDIDSHGVEECEAEAVSYLVSSFLGINDEKAAYYIGNWGGDKELLHGRGKKILTVAEKIVRQIKGIEVD